MAAETATTTTVGSDAGGLEHDPDNIRAAGLTRQFVEWLNQLGRPRVWLVSAAVFAVFAGLFFGTSLPFSVGTVAESCGQAPLDVRFFSSGDDVVSFLGDCGPAGRAAYRNMQFADLLYPLVFGVFLASSLVIVLRRLAPRRPALVLWGALPLAGAGLDYLENLFAWRAIAAFPGSAGTNDLLGIASGAKTITFWLSGVLLLVGVCILVSRFLRHRLGRLTRPAVTNGDPAAAHPGNATSY